MKNSLKCCGFGLFSSWQLWYHEKNCQKKNWVKNSWKCWGLVKIEFLDKNLTFGIVWLSSDFLERFLRSKFSCQCFVQCKTTSLKTRLKRLLVYDRDMYSPKTLQGCICCNAERKAMLSARPSSPILSNAYMTQLTLRYSAMLTFNAEQFLQCWAILTILSNRRPSPFSASFDTFKIRFSLTWPTSRTAKAKLIAVKNN